MAVTGNQQARQPVSPHQILTTVAVVVAAVVIVQAVAVAVAAVGVAAVEAVAAAEEDRKSDLRSHFHLLSLRYQSNRQWIHALITSPLHFERY